MAAKSVRQVTLDFCKKNDPQLPGPALVTPLFLSPEIGGQADAAREMWQTECLYGTVFCAACVARSNAAGPPENRADRSHPARN
jgi:hypothetical protein